MRRPSRTQSYSLAVIVVVAISTLALFYYVEPGRRSDVKHPPTIDSWGIQSGIRYPDFWLNAGDLGKDITGAELNLYNTSSLASRYNGSWGRPGVILDELPSARPSTLNISTQLNFTMTETGCYYARVTVYDSAGDKSDVLEKIVELPDNSPPLPEIVGEPWVWLDSSTSTWHFRVNATDGDSDGLSIFVVIYVRESWESVYHNTFPNANNQTSWYAVGEVALPRGEYMLKTSATDKAGWRSMAALSYFDY
jgi:hypothetical protein